MCTDDVAKEDISSDLILLPVCFTASRDDYRLSSIAIVAQIGEIVQSDLMVEQRGNTEGFAKKRMRYRGH
jgi:hypothetical protein